MEHGDYWDWLLCLGIAVLLGARWPMRNPEGHNPRWWRQHPEALRSVLENTRGSVPPVASKSQLSRADTWTIFGVLAGVFFVIIVPPLYVRIPAFVLVCAGLVWLAHKSHWVAAWNYPGKAILSACLVIVASVIAVPQFVSQWRSQSKTAATFALLPENSKDNLHSPVTGATILFKNNDVISDKSITLQQRTPLIRTFECRHPDRVRVTDGGSGANFVAVFIPELSPGELQDCSMTFQSSIPFKDVDSFAAEQMDSPKPPRIYSELHGYSEVLISRLQVDSNKNELAQAKHTPQPPSPPPEDLHDPIDLIDFDSTRQLTVRNRLRRQSIYLIDMEIEQELETTYQPIGFELSPQQIKSLQLKGPAGVSALASMVMLAPTWKDHVQIAIKQSGAACLAYVYLSPNNSGLLMVEQHYKTQYKAPLGMADATGILHYRLANSSKDMKQTVKLVVTTMRNNSCATPPS